jgi:hypothetical protein
MSYGNTTELWFVQEHNKDLKYNATPFTSERAAIAFAKESCTQKIYYSIYSAKLIGNVVIDEPRFVAVDVVATP